MEKIIFEIERQIERLQAAKQFLIAGHDASLPIDGHLASTPPSPVKRGRGRPRKYPLPTAATPPSV